MNFFGHAALAAGHFARQEPAPAGEELALICSGAMLPDFLGMLRLGRPTVHDASLGRGVAFHHQTDHHFHDLREFQRLSRGAFAWLSERGMPRGPARAVAHIGIEMLLDEVLAEGSAERDAYRTALGVPLKGLLSFPAPSDAERLDGLRRALLERAQAYAPPAADVVAQRIRRTLSGRPRLQTDEAGEALLGDWVETTRPLVSATAPALLAVLRALLANSARAE
jgi:hypothetical protein